MASPENQDRRKNQRISFIKDVRMENIGTARSSVLSAGGMYIEIVNPLPEGSTIKLQFKLYDKDEQSIKVQALVMYIHDGVGMGVAFSNLSPKNRKKIAGFLEEQ